MTKIADFAKMQGQTDEAIRLLRDEVLPTFRKLDEPALLAQGLLRLGLLTSGSGQAQAAVVLRAQARSHASRVGDRVTLEVIAELLGDECPARPPSLDFHGGVFGPSDDAYPPGIPLV